MERDFAEDLDDVICAPNFNTFESYQDLAIVVFGLCIWWPISYFKIQIQ